MCESMYAGNQNFTPPGRARYKDETRERRQMEANSNSVDLLISQTVDQGTGQSMCFDSKIDQKREQKMRQWYTNDRSVAAALGGVQTPNYNPPLI